MGAKTEVTRDAPSGWTIGLTGIAFFMVVLDALAVTTAMPAIHNDLGTSVLILQWTLSGYTLVWAATITTAAALGDRYGRCRMFAIGLCIFAAASAACALSTSAAALIAARLAQGVGAGIIMPLSLTILATAFPAERRGLMIGIWGAIAGVATMSGPLVGGAVTQGLNWQWLFWVNVPIGLAGAILVRARLAESFGPVTQIDPVAIMLMSAGACGLILGLVRTGETGWADAGTATLVLVSLALIAGFAAWELRSTAPMIPPRLFLNRTFSAANATSLFVVAGQFGAVFFTVQYFQIVLRYSPFETGLRLLPWTTTPLVIMPLAGALSDRFGKRWILVGGMCCQAAGFLLFSAIAAPGLAYWLMALPLALAGIGANMVAPVAPAAALSAIPTEQIGKGSAVNSMLQRFGSSLGLALSTAAFGASGSLASAASFDAGFRPAMTAAAGVALVGVLTALAVGGSSRRVAPEDAHQVPLAAYRVRIK